jgi:hypothetical protein
MSRKAFCVGGGSSRFTDAVDEFIDRRKPFPTSTTISAVCSNCGDRVGLCSGGAPVATLYKHEGAPKVRHPLTGRLQYGSNLPTWGITRDGKAYRYPRD